MEEISRENIRKVSLRHLALNSKFGALVFSNSHKKLEKIRQWVIEFEDLDYSNQLPQSIVSNINEHINQFVEHLKWLNNFDISISPNAKQEHDEFENRIDAFYNSFSQFVYTHLVFLRQETDRQSKDKKTIRQEQKELMLLRKKYEELIESATEERKKTQTETKKLASAKGERAATKFGKHFEIQASENQTESKKWLEWREKFFWALLLIILGNVIGYFWLFFRHKFNPQEIQPSGFFTLEYGLAKLALLSILSYGVSFSSRNFNVNSNLMTLNKHRKNVAETLSDFLQTNPETEDRSKIVEKATDAMFRHQPIGYLPKIENKDDGPITSIFNILKPQ